MAFKQTKSFCGPEYINEAYLGQYLGNVDEKENTTDGKYLTQIAN